MTKHYDEAFDDTGQRRVQYENLSRRTGWDPSRPGARLAARLQERPLGDDARIFAFPLVLDDAEYEKVIHAGLVQRAVALQDFFADVVLGPASVLRAGLGLTGDLFGSLLADEATSLARLRRQWRGRGPEDIRFVYGPDLVRGPTGRWTVLEDNIGCVGGSADGSFVADFYRAAAGLPCDPGRHQADLKLAVRRWLRAVDAAPGDVRAVLGCDAAGIRENSRRRMILGLLGIAVSERGHPREPAPRAIVNFDVDERLAEAFTGGRTSLFNAPGTGFLGNKALLPFIDGIIRFFTGREPILPTPPTRLLDGGELAAGAHDWVVKSATGRQGTEVFILPGRSRERLERLERLLRTRRSPTAMVAQRYVPPSRLSGHLVEIRPVTYVLGRHDVQVSRQPAGKVAGPGRLTNLSQGAAYLCVLREPCCGVSSAIPSIYRQPG